MAETVPTFTYEPTFLAGIALWDEAPAHPRLITNYRYNPVFGEPRLELNPSPSGGANVANFAAGLDAGLAATLNKLAGASTDNFGNVLGNSVFCPSYVNDTSLAFPAASFWSFAFQAWALVDSATVLPAANPIGGADSGANGLAVDAEAWWVGTGTVPNMVGIYAIAGPWATATKPTRSRGIFVDSCIGVTAYGLHVASQKSSGAGAAIGVRTEQLKADGVGSGGVWQVHANGDAPSLFGGALVVGKAALATNATDGFIYAPSCAGAPTGVPVAQNAAVPLVIDTTNSKIMVRIGGAWKGVVVA